MPVAVPNLRNSSGTSRSNPDIRQLRLAETSETHLAIDEQTIRDGLEGIAIKMLEARRTGIRVDSEKYRAATVKAATFTAATVRVAQRLDVRPSLDSQLR